MVVDDKVAQAGINNHQPLPPHQDPIHNGNEQGQGLQENPNTIIDLGKPEPGRDIFAKVENEGVKSDTKPVPVHHDVGGEKEISSVNVPVATTVPDEQGGTKEDKKEGSDKVGGESTTTTNAEVKEKEKEKEEVKAGYERPMGPLDEVGEAAEKAAEELFGNDSDE